MADREILAIYRDTPSSGISTGKAALSGDRYLLPREVVSTDGKITSGVANGASAKAITLNSGSAYTTSAKILSLQNNGVEKLAILQDGGVFNSSTLLFYASNSATANFTYGQVISTIGIFNEESTSGFTFNGKKADSSGVAITFNASTELTASGAIIARFSNGNMPKAEIDKDGNIESDAGLGLHGNTAPAQHSGTGSVSIGAAGSTNAVFRNTTFDGVGSGTAYTIGDIVECLKDIGALAA